VCVDKRTEEIIEIERACDEETKRQHPKKEQGERIDKFSQAELFFIFFYFVVVILAFS
jgi:hypothetical protein